MGRYSDQWDWYECEWCRVRGSWTQRPCLRGLYRSKETLRAKWEACERVRMENAAKRNKTLSKAYRRAMMAAAKAEDKGVPDYLPIRPNTGVSIFDRLRKLHVDERTPAEVDSETDSGTEKAEASPLPAAAKSTPKPKQYHEVDAKKTQQRQAKSSTGPKRMIDEGVSLASDDDGDVARIHAANRKAWPRGQEPIAADATVEDREIAELLRRGLIAAEDLQVDHDGIDGDDYMCPYTVRFVEARKKGRKGNHRRRQEVQVAEPAPSYTESDWWYLEDEAYHAQLLSDGGSAELVEWSEASSFVYVD
ncbi:uncharacterized protein B0H64DRAFT_391651 [Chaetomium fimeti]|uniref:Uncharacterized protein n=1 Tax=Chaetomium fimeti TaxID=1854472 RepID=A0AAE0LTR7_9PEZI|nr:hypothetical protein B0H64DRAFT_391651 [Chaetomium fimeti]